MADHATPHHPDYRCAAISDDGRRCELDVGHERTGSLHLVTREVDGGMIESTSWGSLHVQTLGTDD